MGKVILAGVGGWYGKALKLQPVAHPEEREAIAALGRRKVAKAILILVTLTFSKHFYLFISFVNDVISLLSVN